MKYPFYTIIPALFLTLTSSLLAQENPDKYAQRGNRSEGFNFIKVDDPDFEIVSFTAYKESDYTGQPSTKLDFYLPQSAQVYILAQEILLKEYYQMRPNQVNWPGGWNTFSPWPVELMAKAGVNPDDLGILGRIGTDEIGSGHIVPLLWYSSNPISNISKYTLICRSNETIFSLEIKVLDSNNTLAFDNRYFDIGKSMPLEIELNFSSLPEGNYTLLIEAKYESKLSGLRRRFTFYHKPNRD